MNIPAPGFLEATSSTPHNQFHHSTDIRDASNNVSLNTTLLKLSTPQILLSAKNMQPSPDDISRAMEKVLRNFHGRGITLNGHYTPTK